MGDSETGDRCSNSTDSITNINDVPNNKEKSVDDDRIDCTNSHYLDKIYEVAIRHVTELVESHLNEDKPHFIARFSEIFKNVIEENVTVKGLPWIANKEKLTTDEKQEQKQETMDALLSRLSKTLEKTAEKRKAIPQACCRMYGLQSKHERQNLKRAKLETLITLPSVPTSSKSSLQDHSKELLAVYKNIELAQQQIAEREEQLFAVQKRVEFAKHIAKQHDAHSETLYDTGYISE